MSNESNDRGSRATTQPSISFILADQMPTFGPSWVNLYGTPRTYTYDQAKRPEDELNKNLGEGVAFRGRLLMAIKAQPSKEVMKTGAILRGTPSVSEVSAITYSPAAIPSLRI